MFTQINLTLGIRHHPALHATVNNSSTCSSTMGNLKKQNGQRLRRLILEIKEPNFRQNYGNKI